MVFDKSSYAELETQLDELDAQFKIREIEVTFNTEAYFFGQVTSSKDVFDFLKERILKGIEIQEHFIAIYLNQANNIIGYYHHSTGTINATMVDVEIVAVRHFLGMNNLNAVLDAAKTNSSIGHKCYFIRADIMSFKCLDPFTHVYMIDVG